MLSFYLAKILCLILLSVGNSSQMMDFDGLIEFILQSDPIEWGVSVTLCGNVTLGNRGQCSAGHT